MKIFLMIYFLINTYLAGRYHGEEFPFADDGRDRLRVILVELVLALFGVPIHVVVYIWALILHIWERVSTFFQLQFFWQWHFTKKWETVENGGIIDQEGLLRMNREAFLNKSGNKLRHRIFRYGLAMVNKKHNYTFKENDLGNWETAKHSLIK